jgi:hypothetical protein
MVVSLLAARALPIGFGDYSEMYAKDSTACGPQPDNVRLRLFGAQSNWTLHAVQAQDCTH